MNLNSELVQSCSLRHSRQYYNFVSSRIVAQAKIKSSQLSAVVWAGNFLELLLTVGKLVSFCVKLYSFKTIVRFNMPLLIYSI